MDALTLVFVNTSGRPMNFYGAVYGPGELVVGMEDERNVSSVMSTGAVVPVVLESLPSDVQSEYADAIEAYRTPAAAPEPEPVEEVESATEVEEATEMSKEELYELAQELDIPGRSNMSKEELAEAVAAAMAS